MWGFDKWAFDTQGFMPHGHCYLWKPEILWLHVVSDALIFLSYLAIPIILISVLLRRQPSMPYKWILLMFSGFIIFCGLSHVMEIVTIWYPYYFLSGLVKAATAAISISTAILCVPVIRILTARKL